MLFYLTKTYAHLHAFAHKHLGINIRGLGFLYRQFNTDRVLTVKGKKMFLNHNIADNYGRLINDKFNEPETHVFIDACLQPYTAGECQFVEVGANVGEFVLDYSGNSKVGKVIAFEPQPEHWKTNQETIKLNGFTHVKVLQKAVADTVGTAYFNFKASNSSASGLVDSEEGTAVETTTLDTEITNDNKATVILIDVEGAELKVMQGGRNFIRNNQPLIIFEYNHVSRRYFTLDEIRKELGEGYHLYRLTATGHLDEDFSTTWNVVALPSSNFAHVQQLIKAN